MTFWDLVWISVIVSVGLFAFNYYLGKEEVRIRLERFKVRLGSIKDFSPSQEVYSPGAISGLAVDESRKKLCILRNDSDRVQSSVFSYRDLLSSEIEQDGETVTKTQRSSQIGGALIGGLAFGGVGAIIGGLSGSQKTESKVRKVALRIIVNDSKQPVHEVVFLAGEVSKDSDHYSVAMKKARHWHGVVAVLIKRADQDDKVDSSKEVKDMSSVSVADELQKLARLRDEGLLSNEEFNGEKEKLLKK